MTDAKAKYNSLLNDAFEAIVALKEKSGSSGPAIRKYIKSINPDIIDNNNIKLVLKRGVTAKTLIQTEGVAGASGSFKVAKAEAKPKKTAAKKPAKKVVKPKAVAKKPKKAVTSKKAAKSPKKAAKSPKKVVTPKRVAKPKKPAAKKVVKAKIKETL